MKIEELMKVGAFIRRPNYEPITTFGMPIIEVRECTYTVENGEMVSLFINGMKINPKREYIVMSYEEYKELLEVWNSIG